MKRLFVAMVLVLVSASVSTAAWTDAGICYNGECTERAAARCKSALLKLRDIYCSGDHPTQLHVNGAYCWCKARKQDGTLFYKWAWAVSERGAGVAHEAAAYAGQAIDGECLDGGNWSYPVEYR